MQEKKQQALIKDLQVKEEIKQQQEKKKQYQVPQITCRKNNRARLLCATYGCQNQGVMCVDQQCECYQDHRLHRNCQMVLMTNIAKNCYQKKKNKKIPQQIQAGFIKLQQIYNQAINQFSIGKQNLHMLKQNYGLSLQQAYFMFYLQNKQNSHITGKLLYQANKKINFTRIQTGFNLNWMQRLWQDQRRNFDRIINSLNKIVKNDVFDQKLPILQWNSKIKHEDIQIIDRIAFNKSSFKVFCIIGEQIEAKQLCKFKVRITSKQIKIGICLKSWIGAKNYNGIKFDDYFRNKCYCIDQSGNLYSYSMDKSSYNKNNLQKIRFNPQRLITVTYCAFDKKIKFINQKNEQIQLDVINPPENDNYIFFLQLPPNQVAQIIPIYQ